MPGPALRIEVSKKDQRELAKMLDNSQKQRMQRVIAIVCAERPEGHAR